ncbi:MAG: molybdate ABC transporter substrate-binding protein [Candidatus Wallbacteria bacterium]|nr:molybdate ABC transporter substrate-binding protein [Candidatus Wallbacteria bacterium]
MRKGFLGLALVLVALLPGGVAGAEELVRVAAAADLRPVLPALEAEFAKVRPGTRVEVILGSSGKLATQIENGAPFDVFFSADRALPARLAGKGLCDGPVQLYARGRLALWNGREDVSRLTLADLKEKRFRRIAIANPEHAPYGQRAREALQRAGVWSVVQDRIVLGENVSQTAELVESGAADVGILALSLALTPELARKGAHATIPENLHQPLEQGYCVLKGPGGRGAARAFVHFVGEPAARAILRRHGFAQPGEGSP